MLIASLLASVKDFLEITLHLSRDALHVHVGILLFLGLAGLLRRSPRPFRLALAGLFAICLVNEALDVYNNSVLGISHRWLGSLKDIVNTMFWPAVLVHVGPAVARLFGLGIVLSSRETPASRPRRLRSAA